MNMSNVKKGIIIYNSFSKTQIETVNRYKDEFEKAGVLVDLKRNNELKITIGENGNIYNEFDQYDFCLFYDQDEYVGKMLEKCGVRLFNSIESIINCSDKMLTHICLSNNNIKMPKTIPGLHCYSNNSSYTDDMLNKIISDLKLPLIFKLCYGGRGENVYKIDSFFELKQIANNFIMTKHLFQEYIESSFGRDVRVIVIGNKVKGAMLRTNENDFRANLGQNGKGSKFELPQNAVKLCEKVSKILKLDYCGIDLLFDIKNDDFYVCEVNSNAYVTGFEKYTRIKIAKHYVKYILSEIYG